MKRVNRQQGVVLALGLSSLVSIGLFIVRSFHYNSAHYWFLNWNLLLAWLPLVFAWQLHKYLKKNSWLTWQAIVLTILWLGFLPNSFYLSSDLIHLQNSQAGNILYDVVLLLSYTLNGFLLGFGSLFIVHKQLVKRTRSRNAHSLIGLTLFLCSLAIYFGRYLRWNTWDVLVNPAGLLFDVSDRIINPAAHPQTFVTTATFFILLGSAYIVIWQVAHALQEYKD